MNKQPLKLGFIIAALVLTGCGGSSGSSENTVAADQPATPIPSPATPSAPPTATPPSETGTTSATSPAPAPTLAPATSPVGPILNSNNLNILYHNGMTIPLDGSVSYRNFRDSGNTLTNVRYGIIGDNPHQIMFVHGKPVDNMPTDGAAYYGGSGYNQLKATNAIQPAAVMAAVDFGLKKVRVAVATIPTDDLMKVYALTFEGSFNGTTFAVPGHEGMAYGSFFGSNAKQMGGNYETPELRGVYAAERPDELMPTGELDL